MRILSDVIHEGWAKNLAEAHKYDSRLRQVIELYWNSCDELTMEEGLVYKGHRLVIPFRERPGIVKSLHESHIGKEGTLRRAHVTLFTGLGSQPSSKITYQGVESVTVISPNNVKSHLSLMTYLICLGRNWSRSICAGRAVIFDSCRLLLWLF